MNDQVEFALKGCLLAALTKSSSMRMHAKVHEEGCTQLIPSSVQLLSMQEAKQSLHACTADCKQMLTGQLCAPTEDAYVRPMSAPLHAIGYFLGLSGVVFALEATWLWAAPALGNQVQMYMNFRRNRTNAAQEVATEMQGLMDYDNRFS